MTQTAQRRLLVLAILAGGLIALLNLGIRANFGLFLEPLSEARGWGREIFALAIAIQNLLLYFACSVAIALFVLVPPSTGSVLLFSAVIGVLWLSTVPLTSGLVALMFGPRYMATLFGIVFFSHQMGAFPGVWLGGYLYDTTGSYQLVWWLSVALGILAGLLHWPIREQPVVRPAPAT